jgi:hypothetical protein
MTLNGCVGTGTEAKPPPGDQAEIEGDESKTDEAESDPSSESDSPTTQESSMVPAPVMSNADLEPLARDILIHLERVEGRRRWSSDLLIRSSGEGAYSKFYPGDDPDEELGFQVEDEQMSAIATVLQERNFCQLSSSATQIGFDEGIVSLRVRVDGVDCGVKMLSLEWTGPDATACLAAVEALVPSKEP